MFVTESVVPPMVGGVWELGAASAFPGLLVVIVGPAGARHYAALVFSEYPADPDYGDVALDADAVRWIDPGDERPRPSTLVTMALARIDAQHLVRRVGAVRLDICERVRAAASRSSLRAVLQGAVHSAEAPDRVVEPTVAATANLEAIHTLDAEFHEALARDFADETTAEPTMAQRAAMRLAELFGAVLRGPRLVCAPQAAMPRDPCAVSQVFAKLDGTLVAVVEGELGAGTVTLTVDFDDAAVDGVGPVAVVILDEHGEALAQHEFDDPSGRQTSVVTADPEAVTRGGVEIAFGRRT